jgi:hypothetical protein
MGYADRSAVLKDRIYTYRRSNINESLDNGAPKWHTTKGYGRVIEAVPISAVPAAG